MVVHPLVSIVVPLYNVKKTVRNCLESLRVQTYDNFEVIIVNDGSPDQSAEVCHNWIEQCNDGRFKVIDKDNGGLSDARNYGIAHCAVESEYVVFVDSDDELTPDALSILINYATSDNLVIGSVLRCKKNDNPQIALTKPKPLVLSNIWHNYDFLDQLRWGIVNSSCGNCYSLKVIRDNKLAFKKLLPEDTFFNVDYLSVVSDVVYIDRPLYYYYIWSNSMSTKPKEEIYTNYMLIQQQLYQMVGENDKEYIDRFAYPQYRVNTMNFIKKGDMATPKAYLKQPLVSRAIASYNPVTLADGVLNFCLRHRWLKIAKLFS